MHPIWTEIKKSYAFTKTKVFQSRFQDQDANLKRGSCSSAAQFEVHYEGEFINMALTMSFVNYLSTASLTTMTMYGAEKTNLDETVSECRNEQHRMVSPKMEMSLSM